jgi:hypothetical protein
MTIPTKTGVILYSHCALSVPDTYIKQEVIDQDQGPIGALYFCDGDCHKEFYWPNIAAEIEDGIKRGTNDFFKNSCPACKRRNR